MRPGPAASTPRCCPSLSGSGARSTRPPWPPAPAWPSGLERRGVAAGAPGPLAPRLPSHEQVLGAERPQTLAARHDLAYWTAKAGDAASARDQLAALLPIREQLLGA